MFGLDNKSGINVMPPIAPADSQSPLWFTEGGAGLSATYPGQDWFNQIQAELLNILKAADITPQKGSLNQISSAISKLASAYAVSIVHSTGQSLTSVMSQKAVTDEQNKKFDKTGGTITGGVTIQSSDDFPTLNMLGNNGDSTRIQANTSDTDYMLTIASRDSTGKIKSVARFPNKNGTVLFSGDAYTTQETDSLITSVKNTALKQAAGWHKDESTGVITQWGEVNKISDDQPYIMQFPIPFPTAITAMVTQMISNETAQLVITPRIRPSATNRTQFAIQHGKSEGRYYWIAKGY